MKKTIIIIFALLSLSFTSCEDESAPIIEMYGFYTNTDASLTVTLWQNLTINTKEVISYTVVPGDTIKLYHTMGFPNSIDTIGIQLGDTKEHRYYKWDRTRDINSPFDFDNFDVYIWDNDYIYTYVVD